MLIRHATFRRNLESIRVHGLCTRYSRGRMDAVWLHTASRSAWAAGHVCMRHAGRLEDVVILLLDVPDRLLRRHGGCKGLRYTLVDVPPECIQGVLGMSELFKTEVDGD